MRFSPADVRRALHVMVYAVGAKTLDYPALEESSYTVLGSFFYFSKKKIQKKIFFESLPDREVFKFDSSTAHAVGMFALSCTMS